MSLAIENTGSASFPFGLGWHPFFPRTAATGLSFAVARVWQTDATVLPTQLDRIPPTLDFTLPRPIGAITLDHCFTGWRPPATLRWPARGLAATLSADAASTHPGVYVPAGRHSPAIPPHAHMT